MRYFNDYIRSPAQTQDSIRKSLNRVDITKKDEEKQYVFGWAKIAVDENGQVVDGDLILYVCGQYLKKHGDLNNNTVVTTVMSNLGLYKAFDAAGIAYEKTAVGDKYVNENMVRTIRTYHFL